MKNKYLNKVVNQLVSETTIDYELGNLYTPFFSPYSSIFFNYDSSFSFTRGFKNHCIDVYGLTKDEIEYIWKEYKDIIIDKIKHKWIEPIELFNESTGNKFIDKVVKMMVKHTKLIPNPINHPYITRMHVRLPFKISGKRWDDTHGINPSYITHPTPRMLVEIRLHLRDIYGMKGEEREEAVKMYLSKVTDMINDHNSKSLNESIRRDKQNEYYSDVAQQLVKESTIDDIVNYGTDDESMYDDRNYQYGNHPDDDKIKKNGKI